MQSVGREGTKDISFTVSREDKDEILNILEENPMDLKFNGVDVADDVAKVSVVGAGMMTHPGVAAKVFEALSDAGINIKMIFTSEIRISVLIHEKYADRAMMLIHDKFQLGE